MTGRCNVLMVYPRFIANSFWNYQKVCELLGAKYPAPPLGLITVAAMLPESWDVRLINRNTEELTEKDIEWADMVMSGGMLAQQWDTLDIIALAHRHGKPAVVGGPGVTATPEVYESADFRVLGEAEAILHAFISAWRHGVRSGTFEAPKFQADVTKSPVPRFDLLRLRDYLHVGIQFSRGCPFLCEFCDIIELYGRTPRTKTVDQILAELDRLFSLGHRGHVDFVDDNLVGNKKAVKHFLPHLIAWQEAHSYPFEFSTEASINLADDPELLSLMRQANFFAVFVGIESPDPETLAQMRKKQNTGRELSESIARIYASGMFGFDNETRVAAPVAGFIEEAAIPVAMVGLLYALPNTQLSRRLMQERRLFVPKAPTNGDQCTAGLNFLVNRPRREILEDYRNILEQIYAPPAYFARVERVSLALDVPHRSRAVTVRTVLRDLPFLLKFIAAVIRSHPDLRHWVSATILRTFTRNPRGLPAALRMMVLYFHLGPFARYVINEINQQIAALDDGTWQADAILDPSENYAIAP